MKKNVMESSDILPWFFSVHGGHSKNFCEHARGYLINIIKKAISLKMPVYGVTEHAPRVSYKHLYPEEIDRKLTPEDLLRKFDEYCKTISKFQKQFQNSIVLTKGLEIEVVPRDSYVEITRKLVRDGNIEYIIGSVHWIDDIPFDLSKDEFTRAVNKFGLVKLIKRYYEILRDMVSKLEPAVVGHLDLITCFLSNEELTPLYPKIEKDIEHTLETVKKYGALLEVNTSGYRKEIKRAFPDAYILCKAKEIGIPITFGDDSHSSTEVGAHIKKARKMLLKLGITEVVQITKSQDLKLSKKKVSLI